jgi:hypothetical protein
MVKKWIPMPDHIRAALEERVQMRYHEIIARLPKMDFPNPSISHEVSADGFKADVKFYRTDGRYSSSLWEYQSRPTLAYVQRLE